MKTQTREAKIAFETLTGTKVLSARANVGSMKALVSFTLPITHDELFEQCYMQHIKTIGPVPFEFMRPVYEKNKITKKYEINPAKVEVDVYWQDLGL